MKAFRLSILYLIGMMVLGSSCAKQPYYIDARTEQQRMGEYVIQWDVRPGMEGQVAIYASSDASIYPQEPFVVESISKASTSYTTPEEGYAQTYFLLVFNGLDSRVATSRIIPTQGILNLRDAGGYMTGGGEQMKWGKLYRSGDLHRIGELDRLTIASLGIQNQYILSPSRITPADPVFDLGISTLNSWYIAPDVEVNFQETLNQIYREKLSDSGVKYFLKDLFTSIAFENPNQISVILHTLIDPNNYPILLSDDLGKDRVSFVVMLVQYMLGVSRADIINDYLLSNQLLPVEQLEPAGHNEPFATQEALTQYFKSEANQINSILNEIESRYGSVNKYLEEFLHFDMRDQAFLRRALLY